jgi:hypothetical protein
LPLLLAISGIILNFYQLSPKLDLHVSSTLDASNPFETRFEIKNESLFPIYNLIVYNDFKQVWGLIDGAPTGLLNGKIVDEGKTIARLNAGEKTSIVIPMLRNWPSNFEFEKADLDIRIVYHSWSIPSQKTEVWRYRTEKNNLKQLIWLSKSVSEK